MLFVYIHMYVYKHKSDMGYKTSFPNSISPTERHDAGNKI